jgi:pimeloyl-ACP methyl ester carboxylesterase
VHAWKKQLDEGGSAGWSQAFMQDRFHADALSPQQWQWFETEQAKWTPDVILNALAVLIGVDLTPRLGFIKCPTLLLHPDGSPFIPVPVMAELHGLLGDARLTVIGHARHGLPFSHALECATLLRNFLDSRG